jgi:low temperature requirement protein LtrA
MSTAGAARVATEGGDSYQQRVTPLELFFDLVFVFALTQVTGFLANHPTWLGMLQGAALLAVLWSSWAVYSWLTNAVPAEEVIPARRVIFCAMAAMFVAALAIPGAFGEYGVIFGVAYLGVQLLQVLLFALATGLEPGLQPERRAILRGAPASVDAPALLVVASFLNGYAQGALWAVALAVGYGIPIVLGVSGFRIHPRHFAERHGLIIIIALGESIVAVGVGLRGWRSAQGYSAPSWSGSHSPQPCGGRTSTSSCRSPSGGTLQRGERSGRGWRETPSATCTC